MTGEIQPAPLGKHVIITVSLFLQLRRVKHEAQISQMKHSQETHEQVGQFHHPVVLFPAMVAISAAFARLDTSAEYLRQFPTSHVLRVRVKTQRQEYSPQLEVEAVQQGTDSVRTQ